jgi:hypothetical protein
MPHLLKVKGNIVNVSSAAGIRPVSRIYFCKKIKKLYLAYLAPDYLAPKVCIPYFGGFVYETSGVFFLFNILLMLKLIVIIIAKLNSGCQNI